MSSRRNDPYASKATGPKLTLYHRDLSYRVSVEQIKTNSLDFDKPLICPHCDRKLVVTTELIRYGQCEDTHTYTFLCKSCLIGYMYICHIAVEKE